MSIRRLGKILFSMFVLLIITVVNPVMGVGFMLAGVLLIIVNFTTKILFNVLESILIKRMNSTYIYIISISLAGIIVLFGMVQIYFLGLK